MTLVARHGGESHTVRPDRVTRTSVLEPMYGYSPGIDAQNVAFAFTQPPRGLSGPVFGAGGWFDRMRFRIKAAFAAPRANAFVGVSGLGTPSPGPAPYMFNTIAPQMIGPMQTWNRLMAGNASGPVRAGMLDLSRRRPNSWWTAG